MEGTWYTRYVGIQFLLIVIYNILTEWPFTNVPLQGVHQHRLSAPASLLQGLWRRTQHLNVYMFCTCVRSDDESIHWTNVEDIHWISRDAVTNQSDFCR